MTGADFERRLVGIDKLLALARVGLGEQTLVRDFDEVGVAQKLAISKGEFQGFDAGMDVLGAVVLQLFDVIARSESICALIAASNCSALPGATTAICSW